MEHYYYHIYFFRYETILFLLLLIQTIYPILQQTEQLRFQIVSNTTDQTIKI
jgi:hypothetical protein